METFDGVSVDWNIRLSESVLARLHYVIYTRPGSMPEFDTREVEERLVAATRSWADDLLDALVEQLGEERGTELFVQYRDAFPAAYRDDFTPPAAVLDILRMEKLDPEGDLALTLYRPLEAADDFFVLKLLRSGRPILLSDVLPLLEDLGVTVYDERPYEIDRVGPLDAWIYDFGLTSDDGPIDLDAVGEKFKEALRPGLAGRDRDRRLQPPRAGRRPDRARGRSAARARQVPAAGGRDVQPDLHGGDARRPRRHRPQARRAVPAPLRPGAERRAGRRRREPDRRDRGGDRRRPEPRPGPHPARLPPADRGDAPDELLPARRRRPAEAVPLLQARPRRSCPTCRCRARATRSGSTRPGRRACTCAAARSHAEGSAGPTAARTSAPRCSA